MTTEQAKKFLQQKNYQVGELLGEGGFSKVFKCTNPKGELVAAKVIYAENEQDIKREIASSKDIEAAKPLNFSKYQFEFNQAFKQRAKHYYKYFNTPTVKEFSNGIHNIKQALIAIHIVVLYFTRGHFVK